MTRFQKLATGALVSILFLIFVGATVRVTGAGMGCPDWPHCWGKLIPPTSVDQVDFSTLPIEKFKKKAERMGRNPDTITEEKLRAEFNPRHVWTEFMNRLSSFPVTIFSISMFIASFWQRQKRPLVFWMSLLSVIVIFVNAWMGARVVYSGLKPGVLTAHLALAMLLIALLAYCAWRGTDTPWRVRGGEKGIRILRTGVGGLLLLIVAEGILGSQIREVTDELAKSHLSSPRSEWIGELEGSWVYLTHRSASWVVMVVTWGCWFMSFRIREGGPRLVERTVMGIVVSQMILGFVMSQVHIYAWVQLLHVGLAAVLLALTCIWWFGLCSPQKSSTSE